MFVLGSSPHTALLLTLLTLPLTLLPRKLISSRHATAECQVHRLWLLPGLTWVLVTRDLNISVAQCLPVRGR